MRIKVPAVLAGGILLAITLVSLAVYAQNSSCSHPDSDVYDGRIIQVRGKVTISNHPELGKTVASGMSVIFQREDCKKCLIATRANSDGDYEVFIGEGRYKVIAWENRCDYGGTGCVCYDLLAPDQPRYVEAKRSPYPTEFNINIRLPKK
jgi:hypothetical protein